mmetsp:Transcript_89637/g.199233  ORF Transcript_89637/g.199233 Transcript_89637/m.199233 type:complete len:269 (-) Transcript_89637:25-831(-)
MTMAKPFTKPNITECGTSMISRESFNAPAMSCKMPTMKTHSAMGPMPYVRETSASTTAVAADALEIIPGRPPTRAAEKPMMLPAQIPFNGETPVMKENEMASGKAAMAVAMPARTFCNTLPSSPSFAWSLSLPKLMQEIGFKLCWAAVSGIWKVDDLRVISPSCTPDWLCDSSFFVRCSMNFRTKKMTKGTSRKMTRRITSNGCVSRPAELMGKDSSTVTVAFSTATVGSWREPSVLIRCSWRLAENTTSACSKLKISCNISAMEVRW